MSTPIKVSAKIRGSKNPVTEDDAKKLLGWETEEEARSQQGDDAPKRLFGNDYYLRDLEGNRVRCHQNTTNRPFKVGIAKRYASELLRNKWKLNGETIILDKNGRILSGQHRLIGLIFACQIARKQGSRKQITMPTIIVSGISDNPAVVDTIDLGQSRKLNDVVFRNHEFKSEDKKNQKKLADMLSGAARLVWIRHGGKVVSDAPHFPHSEALDFIKNHPELPECCSFILGLDQGDGNDRLISSYVSLPYAVGLYYLMSSSKTKTKTYIDNGRKEADIDFAMDQDAMEFWTLFAAGTAETKTNPILVLRNYLVNLKASSGSDRDEVVNAIVKAWECWRAKKEIKAADLKTKKKKVNGKLVPAEQPRLGGLDAAPELPKEETTKATPKSSTPPKKASTKSKAASKKKAA